MQKFQIAVIDTKGYIGIELIRLIIEHPNFCLTTVTSQTSSNQSLGEYLPFLKNLPEAKLTLSAVDTKAIAKTCELVFLTVSHGTAMPLVAEFLDQNVKVIDLSADFRLKDSNTYTKWYVLEHLHPVLLSEAIYGIPELYASEIKKTKLVANPGCYPTAVILGLFPALTHSIIEKDHIIIDAKSGISGAGHSHIKTSLFCEVYNTIKPYKFGTHYHIPEIEQELSLIAQESVTISFNPHFIPINRGILSTTYARLKKPLSKTEIHQLYTKTWKKHPWIRILPMDTLPETRYVQNTMFCDIGLTLTNDKQTLIIVSAIDNLCRGAAGQAIANANLMFGLPVETGLTVCPNIL